ncbi:MAG: hypothetical protein AAFY71_23585 [Bacteroidota bacterium]
MKKTSILFFGSGIFLIGLILIGSLSQARHIGDQELIDQPTTSQESSDAFDTMMKVLTHKRCINCHPSGDRPRQGEDSHYHRFGVQRGEDGHGPVALQCSTCHQEENNDFSGVPGAPHWHLAPRSMAWEGLNRVEIAQSMLNKENNGNRSVDEIMHHLTEDKLVLWVFEPGVDADGEARETPPVSKEEYVQAVKTWVANGAHIPEK